MRYLVNQYGLSNHWYPRGQQQTHMQQQTQTMMISLGS